MVTLYAHKIIHFSCDSHAPFRALPNKVYMNNQRKNVGLFTAWVTATWLSSSGMGPLAFFSVEDVYGIENRG